MYPILCDKHTQPCIECPSCRAWGKAFHEWEDSFVPPVKQHPAVLKVQATEWASKLFPKEPSVTHSQSNHGG